MKKRLRLGQRITLPWSVKLKIPIFVYIENYSYILEKITNMWGRVQVEILKKKEAIIQKVIKEKTI